MPYEEFLHLASQKKAGMDRLDGVCHLRKIKERGRKPRNEDRFMNNEDSLRNNTKTHRMRDVEQSKWVQEINEVGPGNAGTVDANQIFLSRPINDTNRFCSNPNWNKSVEDRIEEELDRLDNIGVFAANADTEDVYSAVEENAESKKGAANESNEECNLFD